MKLFKRSFALILIMALMLSCVSCGDKTNDNSNENNDPTAFSVTVLNPFGMPIPDVVVYVHRDGESDYNISTYPVQTNSEGKAQFTLNPEYSYSVQLANLPSVYTCLSGYTPAERYAFDTNNITVTVQPNDGYVPELYALGDYMANFTLYDVDGNRYELYEVLKEKKAVALNFWFSNCGPCRMEFPALNTAYNTYKGSLALFAINDYPYETVEHVTSYESEIGYELDMPLFKTAYESAVSLSRIPSMGYPTTVIIDRYGVVSFIHSGYVTEVSRWNALFEYYTSDSYDGTPYNNF